MKNFNRVFDIFLYEGIFSLLFSSLLFILEDPYTKLLFIIAIISLAIAAILGVIGYSFRLFSKEHLYEES
jgi:multisubunit Na+/H+ antiporter MnhC subunit